MYRRRCIERFVVRMLRESGADLPSDVTALIAPSFYRFVRDDGILDWLLTSSRLTKYMGLRSKDFQKGFFFRPKIQYDLSGLVHWQHRSLMFISRKTCVPEIPNGSFTTVTVMQRPNKDRR